MYKLFPAMAGASDTKIMVKTASCSGVLKNALSGTERHSSVPFTGTQEKRKPEMAQARIDLPGKCRRNLVFTVEIKKPVRTDILSEKMIMIYWRSKYAFAKGSMNRKAEIL